MEREPKISIGIMAGRRKVRGRFNGPFTCNGQRLTAGAFQAKASEGTIALTDDHDRMLARAPRIIIEASPGSTFSLFDVTIGKCFHWERPEDQIFPGDLVFQAHPNGTVTAINVVPVEEYLRSVISSEMNAQAPTQFLKAHAILSRSWLLSSLERRRKREEPAESTRLAVTTQGETIRWYDGDDHDLFDVCADDHCQRYHGVTKITSGEARHAVEDTRGKVVTYRGGICDARYSKACGGLTELYSTAWGDRDMPYLTSIYDGSGHHGTVSSEEEASRWILSAPEAYCHTADKELLSRILPDFDRETDAFFRWTVTYTQEELSDIVNEKSGLDFGDIRALVPLSRGPSGRICRLRVEGSRMSVVVGKELEIRRWLSRSHLYSSAFVVMTEKDRSRKVESFVLRGAGWGHGVGLCQIGAAVMAHQGFQAEDILTHYFTDIAVEAVY